MFPLIADISSFLDKFDGGEMIGLVAVAGGLLIGVVLGTTAIIAGYFEELRKAEIDAALKQEMLNRGMSAEEIALVVRAKKGMKERDLKIRRDEVAG